MKDHIYAQMAARRRYLGLSQGALASLAGLSREKVNRVENRREDMSFEHFCRLVDAVGMQIVVVPKNAQVLVDGRELSPKPAEPNNHVLPALPLEQAGVIDGSKAKVVRWGAE